jgi:AraC-like DNA-binding protein
VRKRLIPDMGQLNYWQLARLYYHLLVPQLLHDDTFRRLCRGRDLLATEYQSRVLLEQAAREACLSEFHFHRLFRATFGETPHEFLTRLRMDRARQMLASESSVTDVCFEIGYGSLGSFSSKFRTQFGRSPVEFQREVRRIFGYSAPWHVLMVPTCFGFAGGIEDHRIKTDIK